jgi:hypothetical protein
MFERFRSFADYVQDYELQRSEGLLLRHLAAVHKVLAQTVPDTAKTDTLREMELYLRTLIRQVDSSLLDEWEKLRDPAWQRAETPAPAQPGSAAAAADLTRDPAAFTAAIRVRIFLFLRAVAAADFDQALASLAGSAPATEPWTADRLAATFAAYRTGHTRLSLDPEARNLRHTYVLPSEDRQHWRVDQVLVDPEGLNDWVAGFAVDLAESRARGEPQLRLERVGPVAH